MFGTLLLLGAVGMLYGATGQLNFIALREAALRRVAGVCGLCCLILLPSCSRRARSAVCVAAGELSPCPHRCWHWSVGADQGRGLCPAAPAGRCVRRHAGMLLEALGWLP